MSDYNAAERKHVRQAEKGEAQKAERRREVVAQLMATTPGREYVHDKLAEARCFVTTFNSDPQVMSFNEGIRFAGLQLLGDVMLAAPDQYLIMMQEANARDLTDTARRNNGRRDDSPDPSSGDAPADYDPDSTAAEGTSLQ